MITVLDQNAQTRVKRNGFKSLILRQLGWGINGIEAHESGLQLFGNPQQLIKFSDLSKPLSVERCIGLRVVTVSIRGGVRFRIAGLSHRQAKKLTESANLAYARYFKDQLEAFESEIQTLVEVVDRLKQPRRYPAACLLQPFVKRANEVINQLPQTLPENGLSHRQQKNYDKVKNFLNEAAEMREASIAKFTKQELREKQKFFDEIESNPLTKEQRVAVLTDEDATLVLAGAGSGKTSVMVAKAAYLVERGICQPDDILLLAFGNKAAKEMAARLQSRTGAQIEAMTFHALGNKIIREVEEFAPPLASLANDEAKLRALLNEIVINAASENKSFASALHEWFSEFYWPYKNEWDFSSQSEYFEWVRSHDLRSLNGDRVKSFEEWEIANWLFCNGIDYEYEPVYEHPIPTNKHGTYRPDFRLTESGVYLEHFGVRKVRNRDGTIDLKTAPYIDRDRYLEMMQWKRQLHRDHETTLIETFSYEKVEGHLLTRLEERLQPYVSPRPIPEEQYFDNLMKMGQVDSFTQTVATFLRHYKSSQSTMASCRSRCQGLGGGARHSAFLTVFESIYENYQTHLGDEIDFEDMINRATHHVKTGRYQSPYRHILVDEFQDISDGRASLLNALKSQHSSARIFAVGDDWQSIFRFAGADIHLTQNFGKVFGGCLGSKTGIYKTVALTKTFRSVDRIAIPARSFILKNPSQIMKEVVTVSASDTPAIDLVYYDRGQDQVALKTVLRSISRKASVLLLGRYNFVKPKNLKAIAARFPQLSLHFMTVHGAKGLEADHVIILAANSGILGFPSEITDDPVLNLVLPQPENYEHAEERRLFYVALTRAKRTTTILADRSQPSTFVREMAKYKGENVVHETGERLVSDVKCSACGGRMIAPLKHQKRTYFCCEYRPLCREILYPCHECGQHLPIRCERDPQIKVCICGARFDSCPDCQNGWLVERKGRFGKFLGCIRYPDCTGKKKMNKRKEPLEPSC